MASIKFWEKRSFQEFDITDQGVIVNGKTYLWSKIKYYSWYGEKQSERFGAVGFIPLLEYDPINPYKFGKTQIIEVYYGFWRHVNLEIDSAQVENISTILKQHGVKHISMLRNIIGY